MLTELTEKRYAFDCGGSRIVLRYDMTALLRLEERGYSYMDIFGERVKGQALCDFLECGTVGELPSPAEDILPQAVRRCGNTCGTLWSLHCRNMTLW